MDQKLFPSFEVISTLAVPSTELTIASAHLNW
jgi:hypothetical protein